MNNQIKSKQRVSNFGEVFTGEKEVDAMLNLVKDEVNRIDAKFLEPSVGNGNFLIKILELRLKIIKNNYGKHQHDYERDVFVAVSNIYGIDILKDNILECRQRLYTCIQKEYKKLFKSSCCKNFMKSISYILEKNIIYGDSLSWLKENNELITFSNWSIIDNIYIEREDFDIKFDVIIGNPPYQLNDGGGDGSSAVPLYHKFVEQAKSLNPKYIVMIIPARWYSGGRGLDNFRREMLMDKRIVEIHDFPETNDCFPGINIRGGVCYFLWSKTHIGEPKIFNYREGKLVSISDRPLLENGINTFIRYNEAISILKKVQSYNEETMDTKVSSRNPFGIPSNFNNYAATQNSEYNKILYRSDRGTNKSNKQVFIKDIDIKKNKDKIDKIKVIVSKASPGGDEYPHSVLTKPIITSRNSACTETYLIIDILNSIEEAENLVSYISTRFFRFMVLLMKNTQNISKVSYSLVPIQDWNEYWTDEKLYKKYGLNEQEIEFIKSMIKPINTSNS